MSNGIKIIIVKAAAASILLLFATIAVPSRGQIPVNKELLNKISAIKAIDNHAHPLKYVAAGGNPDNEFDALPVDAMPPFPLPVRLSSTNPEFIGAWRDLYGYSYSDMSETHKKELLFKKKRIMNEQGVSFPSWILDKLNIQTMFANRIEMGAGLTAPYFRWVAFDDALLFPLSNEGMMRTSPDYRALYPGEEKLLKRYLADLNEPSLPASLDLYLQRIVTPTLEHQKKRGAVAIKYEAAYLRKLDFNNPDETIARNTYERYIKGGEPSANDYKALQDFLFHYIAREAGRLELAVHIHCISGVGGYYLQSGSNPLLLESVFNDSSLRKTNFVVIHGGYPFTKEMCSLMGKPNVYADFSLQTLITYPRELSETLRNWFETYPGKILFGTDAFSFDAEIDWGEVAWLSNHTARLALTLALEGMMNDKEIDMGRAIELARMALHDNAAKLYKIK